MRRLIRHPRSKIAFYGDGDAIDNRDDTAAHGSWNDVDKNNNNPERVVRLLTILQRQQNWQP